MKNEWDADKKCLKSGMPKIAYYILCIYFFVIGVICEICG